VRSLVSAAAQFFPSLLALLVCSDLGNLAFSKPRQRAEGSRCPGIVCGTSCRPRVVGCFVLVRSQARDECDAQFQPAQACVASLPGPDLDACDIGVTDRELVARRADCTPARFARMTLKACDAYRKKNAGRPVDEFDPAWPIRVSQNIERYDEHGSVRGGWIIAEISCPPTRQEDSISDPGCSRGSTECISLVGRWEAHLDPFDPTRVTSRPLVTGQRGVRLTIRLPGRPYTEQTYIMLGPKHLKPLDTGTDELGTVVDDGRRINWIKGYWTR